MTEQEKIFEWSQEFRELNKSFDKLDAQIDEAIKYLRILTATLIVSTIIIIFV